MDVTTSSHEPSYYEIALTNRQVIVAFVILLLCLVGAFFSGVWIGRESGVRAAEQMVRNTPPPQKEEKKEGQNLEELEFFESEQQKGTPAEPPEAETTPRPAQTGTTLAEDLGAEEEPAEEPVRQAAESTPAPAARPERQPEKPRVTFPEEGAAEETPRAEPARPQRPTPTAPTPAPAATSGGRMVIQVFSSSEKDQAEKILDRLVGGGQKAYLSPVEVGGRTMYRVRIGPFDSRDRAQQVAEQVRKGFKLDTWITEE
jgi:cell division septation protein DedD